MSRDQIAAGPRVVGVECAIAFGGKESSDVDDPHDHSVADPITRVGDRLKTKAVVKRGGRRVGAAIQEQ